MEYALEVKNLTKEYGDFALKNIHFCLPKGTIMGIIGENGAGKSTTFKAILNLIKADSGEVTLYGKKLTEKERELKEQIGVVFDGISFYQTLTPEQVGKISACAYESFDMAEYEKYLEKFALPPRKEIKQMSKGMQVKLCLSVALSHHAKILLLDEPTSGLDPIIRDDILDVFLDFVQDEEHSILISSHITSDLEKIADYITFIHEGSILLSDTKDNLMYHYGLMKCRKEQFLKLDKADIAAYRKMDYQYEVLVEDRDAAKRKYQDVVIDAASLDEIMLLYVKGARAE